MYICFQEFVSIFTWCSWWYVTLFDIVKVSTLKFVLVWSSRHC